MKGDWLDIDWEFSPEIAHHGVMSNVMNLLNQKVEMVDYERSNKESISFYVRSTASYKGWKTKFIRPNPLQYAEVKQKNRIKKLFESSEDAKNKTTKQWEHPST